MRHDEKEQIRGVGQQIKGKVKEEVGDLTDNKSLEIEGKMEKNVGKIRQDVNRDLEREREGR
jgi:uncharacterized protein YjbJ (UPF0337 family)